VPYSASWEWPSTSATDTSLHANETSFHKDPSGGPSIEFSGDTATLSNRIDELLMDWFILRLYGVALLCMIIMMWFCF